MVGAAFRTVANQENADMLQVGLGQAEGIDTRTVTQRVVTQCLRQLDGRRAAAGVVFAGADFDHAPMLNAIVDHFPDMALVGCTTVGEFSSVFGFSDDSICLMVFASDTIQIRAGIGRDASRQPDSAVAQAVASARQGLNQPPSLCLAFPDGRTVPFKSVLDELHHRLGADCPVFGGCAGRQADSYRPVAQFFMRDILTDALPVLLFAGPLEYEFSIANSWKPIGKKAVVTEADGREVFRINDTSAIEFYRHYLGQHRDPATEFPLAVYETGDHRFYLRGPVHYSEDKGSILFTEAIPSGATVQLTEAIRERIVEDTRSTTRLVIPHPPGFKPACALAFSCALRKDVLGTQTPEEIRILQQNLPPRVPVMGFYGFGEIAPLVRRQASYYHNATLVTLLLGDQHGARAQPTAGVVGGDSQRGSAGPIAEEAPSPGQIEHLRQENEFLQKKLTRSDNYRYRLENIKERNAELHRKIIQEIDAANRKIVRNEKALRKSEEKYRRIVETAGEGFILMDGNLAITDVNDACCRMLGYTRDDLLGRSPLDLATDEFKKWLRTHRDDVLAEDYRRFEGELIARDGHGVPVLIHGSTLKDGRGDSIGHMAFVTDMTAQKKALQLAAEVQKSLQPHEAPRIPGIDIAGRNVSCEEIGGDYFDYFWEPRRPHRPFSVVVGDITGHGVDAALLMSTARAFLRMRASQPGTRAQIVTEMNRHLTRDVLDTGHFMTLYYLTVDAQKGRICWVRAGHDPAVVFDPESNRFDELKGPGIALGLDEAYVYQENVESTLRPGQVMALGTDGLWEATDRHGEMFGKQRFHDVIRRHSSRSAEGIVDTVFQTLADFMYGQRAMDDMTLVVIKVGERGYEI